MKLSRLSAALAVSCALWAAAPVALQAQVRLPSLGESAGEEFSTGAEHRLGEQIMYEVRRDPDYMDDPLLVDYLQTIWQPLVKAAKERGNITPDIETLFAWEPFLVRDRTINAFALPGGYVGVHLGLIAMTGTRDELAAVLAHEMSHVTQRHIARSTVSAQKQSLVGMAAIILGMIAAGRSNNPNVAQAVLATGQGALVQGQLNFSREMEREADRVGYGVLTTAGFSPSGVATMFEKLEASSRINDGGSYPYLRSHPLTIERIGDARSRALLAKPVPQSSPIEHVLMQARARVLMDPNPQALHRLQGADALPAGAAVADRLGALYASALASTQLRDWNRADAAMHEANQLLHDEAHDDARARRAFALLDAQSLLARGQSAAALALIDAQAPDGSRALLLMRAQASVAESVAHVPQAPLALKQNLDALQTWTAVHPHDALAWTELGQTSDQLHLPLRALRAEAEARAVVGDFSGAIDRLRAGQRMAQRTSKADFIDASILEARMRDLQRQRRDWLEELRGEGRGNPDDDDR